MPMAAEAQVMRRPARVSDAQSRAERAARPLRDTDGSRPERALLRHHAAQSRNQMLQQVGFGHESAALGHRT